MATPATEVSSVVEELFLLAITIEEFKEIPIKVSSPVFTRLKPKL
jgi:hypothetical protein